MSRVLLLHWHAAAGEDRAARLRVWAIDAIWSGLKFARRVERRRG